MRLCHARVALPLVLLLLLTTCTVSPPKRSGDWPSRRADAGLAYCEPNQDASRGHALLFGGRDENGIVAAITWLWNGTWTHRTDSPQPLARCGHAMATTADGRVVLFGGKSATGRLLQDTWVWNGSAWEDKTVIGTTTPPARMHARLAVCVSNGSLVLYGGTTGSADPDADDVIWVWEKEAWSSHKTTNAPPMPQGHAFASHGRGIVMHGGVVGNDPMNLSNTTYVLEESGGRWSWQCEAIGQGPANCAFAATAAASWVVHFGGWRATQDVWRWDGVSWGMRNPVVELRATLLLADAKPAARAHHAMCYYPPLDRSLLFGGEGDDSSFLDDMWTYDYDTKRWDPVREGSL